MDTYITKEIALDAISYAETLSEAFRLINNQKAADVVEVVRCKDCHFNYRTPHGERYCNRLRYRWSSGERYYWINDEDYCSWGVRVVNDG